MNIRFFSLSGLRIRIPRGFFSASVLQNRSRNDKADAFLSDLEIQWDWLALPNQPFSFMLSFIFPCLCSRLFFLGLAADRKSKKTFHCRKGNKSFDVNGIDFS